MDRLRRRPHREPAVRLGSANARLRLHLRVVDLRQVEHLAHDDVGVLECLVRVALVNRARAGDVVLDLDLLLAPQDLVVDLRRARLHRLERVRDDRQSLVLNSYRTHCGLSQLLRLGGDRSNRVTHPPRLVVEHLMVFVEHRRDRDDALVELRPRHVGERDHRRPHRDCGRSVDRLHDRVSVGAPEDAAVQHAGERNVYGVPFLTGNASDPVFPGLILPQKLEWTFALHRSPPSRLSLAWHRLCSKRSNRASRTVLSRSQCNGKHTHRDSYNC